MAGAAAQPLLRPSVAKKQCEALLSGGLDAALCWELLRPFPPPLSQLQYVVPRLVAEARGLGCGEDAVEPPWSSVSCPTLGFRAAALCLWKQVRFKALLQEEAFQVRAAGLRGPPALGKWTAGAGGRARHSPCRHRGKGGCLGAGGISGAARRRELDVEVDSPGAWSSSAPGCAPTRWGEPGQASGPGRGCCCRPG